MTWVDHVNAYRMRSPQLATPDTNTQYIRRRSGKLVNPSALAVDFDGFTVITRP